MSPSECRFLAMPNPPIRGQCNGPVLGGKDIIEFDAHLSRREAEDLAARLQGYDNAVEFKAALKGWRNP